jgi:hypothetical protein
MRGARFFGVGHALHAGQRQNVNRSAFWLQEKSLEIVLKQNGMQSMPTTAWCNCRHREMNNYGAVIPSKTPHSSRAGIVA